MTDLYNKEKPRLVACPNCLKQIESVEIAPRCKECNRDMITIVKDSNGIIPIRIK